MDEAGDDVVLLDEGGREVGRAPREEVHHTSTPLHLAFTCYVFGPDDAFLLTRRSRRKRSFPGVWTNTFCGHPRPGEQVSHAVTRRAEDELGLALDDLRLVHHGVRYRAADAHGVVENEIGPVVVARTAHAPRPSGDETEAYRWVSWAALRDEVAAGLAVSPWMLRTLEALDAAGIAPPWRTPPHGRPLPCLVGRVDGLG